MDNSNSHLLVRLFTDENFDSIHDTIRWNGLARIKDETVATHEHVATIFCRIIAEEMFCKVEKPEDRAIACTIILSWVTGAMFHDFNENITGDILYHVKYNEYNGEKIRAAIDEFVDYKLSKILCKACPAENMLVDAMKKEGLEKKVIKLCDWLSMIFYVSKEISLGNKRFKKKWNTPITKMKEVCRDILTYEFSHSYPVTMDFGIVRFLLDYDFDEILKHYE